jgi:PAS domain S-box-containing protein
MNPQDSPAGQVAALPPPTSPEQYLSLVFNSAANMMSLFQLEGDSVLRLISFNRAYLKVVQSAGYPVEAGDLIGKTIDELFTSVFRFNADDCKRHLARYREVLATNRPVSYEEVHDTPNGRYYGETTLSPVQAANGACVFVLFSSNDVTERRRSDEIRRQLEAQLQQSQKLQAIGTLAGGIAHDFNNIITAIMGNAQLLQLDLPPGSSLESCAHHIVRGSERARDLVQKILTFSRQQRQERKEGRLQPVINSLMSLLRGMVPKDIDIRAELPPEEPAILMDAGQVHQMLLNICINAAHAMRSRGGTLTFREAVIVPDERFKQAHPRADAARYVRLQVIDTGHGMDAHTLQRIFEPFFTTKGPGEGTGLGLAVVHGIVGAHDGVIEVESTPGKGAVFSLYFPALEAVAQQIGQTSIPGAARRRASGSEHILFVDDEEQVRLLGKPMLERFGYRVSVSHDGPSALELIRSHGAEFHAVISDLSMPGMNGIELAREAQRLQPDLPFVIMTGYGEANQANSVGARQILAKPFTIDELAAVVRAALNRSG